MRSRVDGLLSALLDALEGADGDGDGDAGAEGPVPAAATAAAELCVPPPASYLFIRCPGAGAFPSSVSLSGAGVSACREQATCSARGPC